MRKRISFLNSVIIILTVIIVAVVVAIMMMRFNGILALKGIKQRLQSVERPDENKS